MQDQNSRSYFNDNKRRIDFVVVFQNKILDSPKDMMCIATFISNLEEKGLHFETDVGKNYPDLTFIKIHGPKNVTNTYATVYNIPLACNSTSYGLKTKVFLRFMGTCLTNPDEKENFDPRLIKHVSSNPPIRISSTERILVIYNLLTTTAFGNGLLDYGITKLLNRGVFHAAYPLHSGDWKWTTEGHLTKRQLLAHYWAHVGMWYKQQPLYLIERYFGPEVGFYFAFLGFYNKMLIIASFVGILCTTYGLTSIDEWKGTIINEVCNSTIKLCPPYFNSFNWKFTLLKDKCASAKFMLVFDNYATVFFAFFMACWGTIFVELWKRRYAELLLKWNLMTNEPIGDIRREFQENTPFRRKCPITNTMEAYVPINIQIQNYSITAMSFLFMIVIVLAALLGTTVFRLVLSSISLGSFLKYHKTFLTMCLGSILSVMFIKIFGKWYGKLSLWLTIKENPRTQQEFDESYIYKRFLLSFVNNYSAMSYSSFAKGRLYTYPGDKEKSWVATSIRGDVCHPAGCIMGICIQLAFIMLFKSLLGNILTISIPGIKRFYKEVVQEDPEDVLPRWEQDYKLNELGRYFLIGDYMEMVMQYGSVTFFGAAFPLAPLCALINNLMELRTDANKYVQNSRRPIPFRTSGLAWNSILSTMTHVSVICNAFVIAFTSDFVRREIYKNDKDTALKGYIESTLSVFDTKDLENKEPTAVGTCYYRGQRNPPNESNKYQLTNHFWYELCIRFVVAIIFEHVILLFTRVLGYLIPDTPYRVKVEIKQQNDLLKEKRIQAVPTVSRGTNVFQNVNWNELQDNETEKYA